MFDIDKLILSTLYYERTKDGVTTVNLSDPRKNTANNLLRQYLALLKDKRYAHLKYRSIDNDTELIKDVLSEIRGAVTKQVEPYQYEVLSNQVNTMQQFATGKTGIGPFALHNNNHILTQIYGVSFAESDNSILTAFGKSRLDRIIDDNGNLILSWISAFINSHVDIAKDPYITALNINAATYDLTALLLRTGFGADALYFLNNPIIRDLAEIELQQSGNIVDNPQISKFRRIQNATRDYIKNTFDDSGLNSYFKDREEGKTKSQRMSFPLIVQIFKSGVLKDMVVNKNARIDPNGPLTVSNMSKEKIYNIDGVKYSPFELQAQLFLAKEAFDKYANSLNQLVQTTKIDTKKQGNTVQQQKEYAARYLNLLENRYFDTNSLLRMMNGSFIDLKTRLGTNMLGDILSQISITATQTFRNTVNSICDYIGDSRPATKDRVSNAVTAYIKQICMNKALEKHGFTSQEWRDMIVGNKTLASRIEGLKRWLMADKSGKYSALVSNGMIINPLLDNLRRVPYIPQFGTEHYDLVTLDNTSDDSQDNSNNYIDAWEQLLDFTVTDENVELTPACKSIRKLANDLAIYAFMTSADTRGFTKFFKYVPISWRKSIGYSDEMESAFNDFSNGNVYVVDDTSGKHDGFLIDIDEFFLNFAYDDTIVPYTDRYTRGYDGNVYNRFSGTSKNFDILNQNGEIVSSSEYALIFPTGMDFRMNEDTGEFPLYIKLQRSGTNRNSADRFLLYRCVGTYLKGGNNIQPIYGLVTPKGVSIRVGAQTYQFYSIGREDQYKHIYDKAGKKMTSQQYDKWLVNTIEQITNSIPEGYAIEDLTKYPTWQRFIQSKFLNPTGVESKELVTVTPYSQYIEETNPEVLESSNVRYYIGNITPDKNTIFVFGSNPEGRHGAGAAKVAKEKFGAEYGVGEGLTGNAYALPTKDLRVKENNSLKSISEDQIIESIKKLYDTARQNPDKQFKVAYRNTTTASLNGYTGLEMIDMFIKAGTIPDNMYFSQEWVNTGRFDSGLTNESSDNTSSISNKTSEQLPQNYVLHSGGANGADTVWGQIGEEFGIPDTPDRQMHYYNAEKTPKGNVQISREDYKEGRHKVAQAAKANWGYKYDTMKDDRLIRNWAQVKYSDAIFAIGHIAKKGEPVFPNKPNDERRALHSVVQGGTGYAVEMAIQAGKPVYIYDQERKKWFKNIDGKWLKSDIPTLTPSFAGIGTRNINQDGIQAIRDVYQKTLSSEGNNAQNNPIQNTATRDEIEEAKRIKEHCKGKGDKS